MGRRRVRVNLVEPGFIDDGMTRGGKELGMVVCVLTVMVVMHVCLVVMAMMANGPADLTEEHRAAVVDRIALNRFGGCGTVVWPQDFCARVRTCSVTCVFYFLPSPSY